MPESDLSKPPLNLLVNPEAVRGKRPWEIDVAELLRIFIAKLEKAGHTDLRLCGSAALSSALIYRLKVETLFLFEKLRTERRSPVEEPPHVLLMPFRFELPSTSIEDLVLALERVLEDILRQREGKPRLASSVVEPQPVIEMDPFIAQIKRMLASFKLELAKALEGRAGLLFSELSKGLTLLEQVRTFIMLLFVASEGLVQLQQSGDDILIQGAFQHGG